MNGLLRASLLALLSALVGCSSKIDGPVPVVASVVNGFGSNAICTCDKAQGCAKRDSDVLTIRGSGFAPLPVKILEDNPRLDLPSVIFSGPGTLTVDGQAENKNPAGVKVEYVSDSELRVTLTPDLVAEMPVGNYQVTVQNPSGKQGVLAGALDVVPGPVVAGVSPDQICQTGGQTVTVSGQNFRNGAKVALVSSTGTYEGRDVLVDASGTSLSFKVPGDAARPLPVDDYDVQVILAEGCSHSLPKALHVVPPPVLNKITPPEVCVDLGGKVVLEGAGFSTADKVFIGAAEAPAGSVVIKSSSAIELTVAAKALPLGSYDITVKSPEGCASPPLKLAVVPPPTLTKAEPASVCTGGTLTLTGTGFIAGAKIILGTTPPSTITGSAVTVKPDGTSLTAKIGPVAPGGPYSVQVVNADGCTSATLPAAVKVLPGPIIVAVDPSAVYNQVAFPIAIFGSGFKAGATVSLGTPTPTPLTGVNVVSPERIDAVVPQTTPPIPPGTYDLTVTDVNGCAYTFPAAIKVIDQLTVVVCAIDPPFGYNQEKTPVTITSGAAGTVGCSAGTQKFVSTPRAWLDVGGSLKPIRSVAFVTDSSLTGVVEAGLTVGGPYDLLVQNPDGQIGLLKKAFTVVDKPVPLVDAINPSTVTTSFTGTITITGKNFRSPVTVQLISANGTKTSLTSPTVNGTGTQITVTLAVGTLAAGAYVVRVTNTDQSTYYDFSSLAITNPAGNLSPWTTEASTMTTARRRHAMVSGRASQAARFLYAMGGDQSAASSAQSTIDVGPLDKFGKTGTWFVQRYKLSMPRTGLVGLSRGRFIYAIGGQDASGAPLKLVERAEILDPSQAPEITSFSFTLGGSLTKGAWYYRVAAVMPATDAVNPGGETLPSDPVVIHAVDQVKVSLTWKAVAGAAFYRIYRTQTANESLGNERLLAEMKTPATTSFTDDGKAAFLDANLAPLAVGSTGVWVNAGIPQLKEPRLGAALTITPDPSGALFIYVAGGSTTGGALLDTLELASVSVDGLTLGGTTGGFTVATSKLDTARERHMLVFGEHSTSPKVPAGSVFLFAGGGTTAATRAGASSVVAAGGQPGAFTLVAELKNLPLASTGYLINDTFYYFGGSDNGQSAVSTTNSCEFSIPPAFKNCNNLGPAQLPSPRMNAALAIESAYFYLSGGGATNTAATKDVLKTIW